MVRIAGFEFETNVDYQPHVEDATVEMRVTGSFTDEDLNSLKNASLLEAVTSVNKQETVVGSYRLVAWKSVEKTHDGYRFVWQTYRMTDLEALKQKNEDLTQALLELAEIVGGGNG